MLVVCRNSLQLFTKLGLIVGIQFTVLLRVSDSKDVEVQLIVNPPPNTNATLYVAGNHELIGPWKPNGLALTECDDGSWSTALKLPVGFQLEFKITQGSWDTVEKNANGADIPNRRATVAEGLVLNIDVASWGTGNVTARPRKSEPTRTGNIQLIENFHSKVLDNKRNLVIYLPPQYQKQPERRFPVFYMQDGQNLFDQATSAFGVEWMADETAERLVASGKIEPLIIVGIYTEANRTDELTDSYNEKYGAGGKANLYAKFLLEELKPFVDRTYRTKSDFKNTAVGGSSLGGLISLWLCEKHPEAFGKCAAVSPAVLWNDADLIKRWSEDSSVIPPAKFWLDVGTKETVRGMPPGAYVEAVEKVASLLHNGRVEHKFVIDKGAEHNESAWQKRFPQILEFLFPAK